MNSLQQVVEALQHNAVIAYPTETVFGLGCNPNSDAAIEKLLKLKGRPADKGLLILAPAFLLLAPFINTDLLTSEQLKVLQKPSKTPTSWLVPVKDNVSKLLTGGSKYIGVRLCTYQPVLELCKLAKMAIVSTSANKSGYPTCVTPDEIIQQFGNDLIILNDKPGNARKPSKIINLISGEIIRE